MEGVGSRVGGQMVYLMVIMERQMASDTVLCIVLVLHLCGLLRESICCGLVSPDVWLFGLKATTNLLANCGWGRQFDLVTGDV